MSIIFIKNWKTKTAPTEQISNTSCIIQAPKSFLKKPLCDVQILLAVTELRANLTELSLVRSHK